MSANYHSLEDSVRPSMTLIDILRRRLLDPGIVPAFERRRANDLTGGLVRPRWVLIPASEDSGAAAADTASAADNDDGSSGAKNSISDALAFGNAMGINALGNGCHNISMPSTKSNGKNGIVNESIVTKYNAVPKRNYIDLRMIQNRMFADDQSVKCRRILSTLSSLAEPDPLNSDSKKWQKHADSLQSMVNEGLAACPNHADLLAVESDYKGWLQRRMDLLVAGTGISAAATSKVTPAIAKKKDISVEHSCSTSKLKKGAEGRAHAAIDALAERSFLLQGGGTTAVGGGGKLDGDNKEEGVKYPLLLHSGDEGVGEVNIVHGAGGECFGRRDREERRNRSKSKDHRKYHKSGDKIKRSRSRNDDKRRRVGDERLSSRRRSRSSDSGRSRSRSVSSSRSSSSSYSRRRHRRRKEKRSRGGKKKRTRDERRRSRSYDSGRSRSRSISTSSSRSSSSSYSRRRNDRHKQKRRRESKKKKIKRHRRHRGSRGGNEFKNEEVEEGNGNNTQLGGERHEVKEIGRGELSDMLTDDCAGKFD